jgi:UPF0042 nucleotide-binding protein
MKLMIISGRSGSGKSTALHVLEDMGFYCVDNLPIGLLPELIEQTRQETELQHVAVGIDARNLPSQLKQLPAVLDQIRHSQVAHEILFLDADDQILLQRFSETRRKHPLSNSTLSLQEAVSKEKLVLAPIASAADVTINTSDLTLHQLRDRVKQRVHMNIHTPLHMSILFYSFAFKNGVPADADMVFDVRCLPNPHWIANLRPLTGLDQAVAEFLSAQPLVQAMLTDIQHFLDQWLPKFEANNRSYMTVAIGCTGGQHRSVYLAQQLCEHTRQQFDSVLVRHRELAQQYHVHTETRT